MLLHMPPSPATPQMAALIAGCLLIPGQGNAAGGTKPLLGNLRAQYRWRHSSGPTLFFSSDWKGGIRPSWGRIPVDRQVPMAFKTSPRAPEPDGFIQAQNSLGSY